MKLIEEVIHKSRLHLLEKHDLPDLIGEGGELLETSLVRLIVHDLLICNSDLIRLLLGRLDEPQSVDCEASSLAHGFKLLLLLETHFGIRLRISFLHLNISFSDIDGRPDDG